MPPYTETAAKIRETVGQRLLATDIAIIRKCGNAIGNWFTSLIVSSIVEARSSGSAECTSTSLRNDQTCRPNQKAAAASQKTAIVSTRWIWNIPLLRLSLGSGADCRAELMSRCTHPHRTRAPIIGHLVQDEARGKREASQRSGNAPEIKRLRKASKQRRLHINSIDSASRSSDVSASGKYEGPWKPGRGPKFEK